MNHDETSNVAMKDQNVTYMLMDDLVIQPFSPVSIITLLNKFNFKQVGTLQEIVVEVGMDECVELIKTSLKSKMVLTTVFIKNKKDFAMSSRLKSMAIRLFSIILVFSFIRATLKEILIMMVPIYRQAKQAEKKVYSFGCFSKQNFIIFSVNKKFEGQSVGGGRSRHIEIIRSKNYASGYDL
ncbi:hypothetical protein P8452_11075 [Trifolium repens]|nr:hypothetical protein P8452_11075 [Trifolium repens]